MFESQYNTHKIVDCQKELNLYSDQYNWFSTFWTIGYLVGMIPSQILLTRMRASVYIPAAELIWAVVTFCFAAVKSAKQVYAMRFLVGLAESPFYVGAMTLLGNWYTPKGEIQKTSILLVKGLILIFRACYESIDILLSLVRSEYVLWLSPSRNL